MDEDLIDGALSEAIHSCALSELFEGKFSFVIDFGTAKEAAMVDLIDHFNDNGAIEISIETTDI